MTEYVFFWSGPFSNWARSPFMYKGYEFNTAEQAMMWEKAITFDDSKTADRILATLDAREQKALGRQVRGYDDNEWSAIRYETVKDILRHKFSQHAPSRAALMETTGMTLVEASPEDKIWGIGLAASDDRCKNPETWQGQNLLGKALTEVRIEFETIKE